MTGQKIQGYLDNVTDKLHFESSTKAVTLRGGKRADWTFSFQHIKCKCNCSSIISSGHLVICPYSTSHFVSIKIVRESHCWFLSSIVVLEKTPMKNPEQTEAKSTSPHVKLDLDISILLWLSWLLQVFVIA